MKGLERHATGFGLNKKTYCLLNIEFGVYLLYRAIYFPGEKTKTRKMKRHPKSHTTH